MTADLDRKRYKNMSRPGIPTHFCARSGVFVLSGCYVKLPLHEHLQVKTGHQFIVLGGPRSFIAPCKEAQGMKAET